MRKWPPVPALFRKTDIDVNLGGYDIPKNTMLLVRLIILYFLYIGGHICDFITINEFKFFVVSLTVW